MPTPPRCTPFPKEASQLFSGNWLHWTPFRHERTDTYSGYGFIFTTYRALASTLIQGLTEYVIYPNRITHNLALNTGTHWRVKKKKKEKVQQWVYDHIIHWLYHTMCHSKAVDLTEWWNSLLKEQLTEKPGDNTLSGSGTIPTVVVEP